MYDARSAQHWARQELERAAVPGGLAIDATMGNGHDTLLLARLVGPSGRVIAFDTQPPALVSTRARLDEAGCENVELICAGHERMAEFVQKPVCAAAFNLGWLPGGAHGHTTRAETTVPAVRAALALLAPGGLISICAYPGHAEGRAELDALIQLLSALDKPFAALHKRYLNQPERAPEWLGVQRLY